jgi:hypothetical protein
MPITWELGKGGRVDVVFSDPYTLEESEKTMKAIFADPTPARPLRMLVDVRQSAPPDTEFVVNAINFWQLHVDKMWGAKVAVVTANDAQADMGHISERSAEARELPFTLHVFLDAQRADAEAWLQAA